MRGIQRARRPDRIRLGLFLTLLLAGCGARTGTVSGKVTYHGKSLPGGYVAFVSQAEGNATVSASIHEDGSYAVPGVPVGPAKVTVRGPEGPVTMLPKGPGGTPVPVRGEPPVKIPPRYQSMDQTDLTCDVTGGGQVYDIDLK